MIKLVRDYAYANRKRIRSEITALYLGALLLELGLFRPNLQGVSIDLLATGVLFAAVTLPIVIAILFLLHLLTAYAALWPLAQRRGLTVAKYVASKHYDEEGISKLKQKDARPWW